MDSKAVEWWAYRYPFLHFRAQSVLGPEEYLRVCSVFGEILETTDGKRDGPYSLRQTNPRYDARMLAMNENLAPDFDPLFSDAWLRMLSGLTGSPELRRIDGGLHSLPKGSRDGWIHTDLCSGWFDESSSHSVLFADHRKCDYFSGAPKIEGANPVEYVRAATMIYYLCNSEWRPGDGGETGLYSSSRTGRFTLVELVPPIDNSILVFECSPHSYHRFVTNPLRVRNSIILWLHTTVEHAEAKWGNAIHRRNAQ